MLLTGVLILFIAAPAEADNESIGLCHQVNKNVYEYFLVNADGLKEHETHKNDVMNVTGPEACAQFISTTAEPKESVSPTVHTSESNWTPPLAQSPPADVYECNDFATQADAQKVYDMYKDEYGDFAGLDSDGDGIACNTKTSSPTPSPSVTNTQNKNELPKTGNSVSLIVGISLILLSVGLIAVLLTFFLRRRPRS